MPDPPRDGTPETGRPTTCPSPERLEAFVAGAADPTTSVHLDACARCRTDAAEMRENLALADRVAHTTNAAADIALDDAPRPAHVIDGYEILDEIERGGQGIVYRARQVATHRVVALKVLLAGAFATSRQRRRFEREIELMAGLEHPSIVTVYESGLTDDGSHFLAMRYVPGTTLDRWAGAWRRAPGAGPRADLAELLRLFVAICDGIITAHQRGVIHRDLKPSNVIVDEAERPHLLDFGLARTADDACRHGTITADGSFLGTLAYMSPEQTRADPGLVDVRSDVYALGVILYELLTGRLPFSVDGDLPAAIDAIRSATPVRPGAVAGDGPRPLRLDTDVDTIVLKALAKAPERRYQSAAALRDDVERRLAGAPIEARRDSRWYVLRKTLARHRVAAFVGVTFLLVLATFAVTLAIQARAVRLEADKVRQIKIFLEDSLASVEPARGGHDASVRELLDETVHWIEIALSDQPEIAASLRATIGNSYRSLALFEPAETQLAQALETWRTLHGDRHAEVAHGLSALGLLRRDQGRLDEAEQLFRQSLRLREELLGVESYEASLALANLAVVRRGQRAFADATRLFEASLRIRRQLFGDEHSDVAMCVFNLAVTAERAGDAETAERLHREALALRRRTLHPDHPDLARSLDVLAALRRAAGASDEAADLLEECLTRRARTRPDGHWLTGQTQSRLGACLAETGRTGEAGPLLRRGHATLLAALGADDERTRAALRRLETHRPADGP